MNILKSLIIWICFIPAAILNGGLREYVLAPAFGQKWALPASGIILSGLIFLITWLMYPRLIKNSTRNAELLAAYNPLTGNLWLLVLAATLFSPVAAGLSMRKTDDDYFAKAPVK